MSSPRPNPDPVQQPAAAKVRADLREALRTPSDARVGWPANVTPGKHAVSLPGTAAMFRRICRVKDVPSEPYCPFYE